MPDQWPEELYDYAANKVLHPDVAALDRPTGSVPIENKIAWLVCGLQKPMVSRFAQHVRNYKCLGRS